MGTKPGNILPTEAPDYKTISFQAEARKRFLDSKPAELTNTEWLEQLINHATSTHVAESVVSERLPKGKSKTYIDGRQLPWYTRRGIEKVVPGPIPGSYDVTVTFAVHGYVSFVTEGEPMLVHSYDGVTVEDYNEHPVWCLDGTALNVRYESGYPMKSLMKYRAGDGLVHKAVHPDSVIGAYNTDGYAHIVDEPLPALHFHSWREGDEPTLVKFRAKSGSNKYLQVGETSAIEV